MPGAEDLEKTVPSSPQKRSTKPQDPVTSSQDGISALQADETQRVQATGAPKHRWRKVLSFVGGFLLIVALGVLGGVQAGLSSRTEAERLARAVEAETQFQLAQLDMQNGRCDIARDRLEYVSELNSNYPDLIANLSRAYMCANATATPNPSVAEGPTPTPDTRGMDQAYSDALALLAARNWGELLLTLDTLRTNYPDHHPIEVDGMYYLALRNRGIARILPPVGDLEGGIYDINRASQIGPLDADAITYRQWAISYIVGQSFWEVDWEQVVHYFLPLATAAPNLHDLSFFTAQERLATASVFYSLDLIDRAERLTREEKWCSASELMVEAANFAPLSPEAEADAAHYQNMCAEVGDVGD